MRRCSVWLALLSLLAVGQRAYAQELTQDRAPRFLLASGAKLVSVDVSRTVVLGRRLSLDLAGASLKEALVAIVAQSGLDLYYSDDLVPLERRVHLQAAAITVAAALTDVLFDTGVDVVFRPNGRAALVRRGTLPQGGTVTGRVTDARTEHGVAGVRVFLDRTRWSAMTDSAGGYRLTGVAPGAYTLVARRIGYRPHAQPVTVEAERETTVDVALQPAPSELEAVVVTATGEQRLLELGHVVGRINADSLVQEAPVATLSELLTARVPGLQVFQTQGAVGGRVTLQVRGPTSSLGSNQPIVVIDGVRYTTGERFPVRCCLPEPGVVELSNPLNDLNPNDIETIEVVKGPSAATLYGTDAANGVIVVTTKRGRPGPARWNAYAKATTTEIRTQDFGDIYWGWGAVNGVPDNPNLSCNLARLASGQCTQQDSVTVIRNPLKDPRYSMFAAKPTLEYGINVSGGQQDLRYYFSADFTDATGPIQMPPALANELKELRGPSELPREWREPNSLTNLNLRSNLSAALGQTLNLRLNTSYIHGSTNSLNAAGQAAYVEAMGAATPANPTRPYGEFVNPAEIFAGVSTDKVDRFVGSASGEWRPVSWIATRATLGLDVLSSRRSSLVRPGDQPSNFFTRDGFVEDTRTRQLAATVDLRASVTARRGRLSARTTVGGQYVRQLSDASGSFGIGLAPGASVVPGARTVTSEAAYEESIVYGGYMEGTLGLNERLFLTGALRIDDASSFGRDAKSAVYPKIGASWLVTAEPFMPRIPGLDELRLRYALGASGKQPDPSYARPTFEVGQMVLNSEPVNVYTNTASGNPDLRPERVREWEVGADISGFDNRLRLEVTWFERRTTDQLAFVPGPPGLGFNYTNLGLTTQGGFEAKLDARVVDTRGVSVDLGLQHSNYSTLVVDNGGSFIREGYPLNAVFAFRPPIGWEDRNGDGILTRGELVRSDSMFVFMGVSRPPRAQTLSAVLGLLDRRVRVSALLERRSGFVGRDFVTCQWPNAACRALTDRNTPLEEQARALTSTDLFRIAQPRRFTRLREVTVALDLPAAVTRRFHLSQATLVASGRNLALWSNFSGPDPEVAEPDPIFAGDNLSDGNPAGIPMGRVFSFRLDLAF